MPKSIPKIFLVLFFLFFLLFPLGKLSASWRDCTSTRCAGDSECSDYPDAICTADHGLEGISAKLCCHTSCRPDAPEDCPDEIFYDSAGSEQRRYCIEGEWRCARNNDPPPPAPAVGDCTTDENCRTGFPDRPYCLLRPGNIEGNLCVRCMEDPQCPPGQYCTAGNSCEARSERNCCYDSDCPGTNEVCWNETTSLCTLGHCCKITEGCSSDADCQGRRCITGTPSHCDKSNLAPPDGSVAEGGRCAKASECSGRFGCVGSACEGTCRICTTNEDCRGKGAGQCRPDESGAGMCGAEAGVSCATNEDCERIHGLPGFECRGGICEPPTMPTAPAAPAAPYIYEVVQPKLEIILPTLLGGFTKILSPTGEVGNRYLILPWIGEYIAAMYKYAIGITGILAGIMIVVAGLIWLTAGGSAERVSTAKSYIESALVGLVIALTSYVLLYAVNPTLTGFESLKVKFVERVPFMGGGMEPERDPSTYSPSPASSSPLPGAAEACGKVGELVEEGKIEIRNGRDKANISSGTIPRGETCLWCYEDEEPYKRSAEACTAGGSQNPVPVNPKLCQLITALYDAGQQGLFSEKLKIGYIIGDHSRCTKKTFDPKCGECVAQARAGTVNHKYKSDHWDGNGMDIVNSVSTLLVMQKYIVETLKNQLEIMDIFGPAGWSAEEAKCATSFADRPAVSLSSTYNCNEGRCGQSTSNKTLCGHTAHIHVGF